MDNDSSGDETLIDPWMDKGVVGPPIDSAWHRNQPLFSLLSLTSAVSASLDLKSVIEAALDSTVKLFNASAGDLSLPGHPDETRSIWLRRANEFADHVGRDAPRLDRNVSAGVVRTGKPVIVEVNKLVGPASGRSFGIVRFGVIPLSARGRILGSMTLGCGDDSSITEVDPQLLETIGSITGAAIDNSRLYLRLKHLSDTDAVTGSYNRRFMAARLDREIKRSSRYGHPLGLLMLDLDSFKGINDTYGHLFGDQVLKKTAMALTAACRETDLVGRFGGDEFIVLLPETMEDEAVVVAGRVAERVDCLRLQAPGSDGREVKVSASLGRSTFPGDGRTANELISMADKALYRQKRQAHQRWIDRPAV